MVVNLRFELRSVIWQTSFEVQYHKSKTKTVECARKAFYYERLILCDLRIFNPVIVSTNLQMKWWKLKQDFCSFKHMLRH